jgi:hypothetical protein
MKQTLLDAEDRTGKVYSDGAVEFRPQIAAPSIPEPSQSPREDTAVDRDGAMR